VSLPKSNDSQVGKLSLLLREKRHDFTDCQTVHDHKDQFDKLVDSLPHVPSNRQETVASNNFSGRHWRQSMEDSIDFNYIRGRFEKLKIATGTRHYCPAMHDAEQHG
jgi:hypothetical protein